MKEPKKDFKAFNHALKTIVLLCLWIAGLPACNDYPVPEDLLGAVEGYVVARNETSQTLNDTDSILVEIVELSEKFHTYADEDGYYLIEDIPPGTYTIQALKEGFLPHIRYNVSVIGNNPVNLKLYIYQTTSFILDSVFLSVINEDEIYFNAYIAHDTLKNTSYPYFIPRIIYFMDTSANVSCEQNLQFVEQSMYVNNNNWTREQIYPLPHLFENSDSLYLVAYGCNTYFTSSSLCSYLGTPSETVSIKVPW